MTGRFAVVLLCLAMTSPGSAQESEDGTSESAPDAEPARDELGPDSEEAHALFRAGRAAYQDGRFEEALARWRASYELTPHPELLYNIALTLDHLVRVEEALELYEAFLEAHPDAPNANFLRRRIELMRASLDALESQEENSVEEPVALGPPELSPLAAADVEHGADLAGPAVLFGIAGVAAVASVVTGLLANDRYQTLDAACPDGVCGMSRRGDLDSLRAMTTATDVLIGVAGAAAVGALIWWIVADSETRPDEATVSAACGPSGCAASLQGRF